MKHLYLIGTIFFLLSCAGEPARVAHNTNSSNAFRRPEKPQDTALHTTENQVPKELNATSNGSGKWSASGDPIDTTKFDKAINEAEKAVTADPSVDAKKAAAQAYYERGFALTEARQYASAIGDYRRALKYDPDHKESKNWIDQIVSIYQMLKKEPPKPGEEPSPLPFRKP